jgi:hypothetical protein
MPMDSVRLLRTLLGLAIFLAAAYLFEPSLFGGRLPAELMANEMLRNVVGVAGAVGGILLMIDALFPKPKPAAEPLFSPIPTPEPLAPAVAAFRDLPQPANTDEAAPTAEEIASEQPAGEEKVWGAYVAPDADTLSAARSLVEADYETPKPPPAVEAAPPEPLDEPRPSNESEGVEVGHGLPPPPPKPEAPQPSV